MEEGDDAELLDVFAPYAPLVEAAPDALVVLELL